MNDKYKELLTTWAIRTAVVIALSVSTALIQRWLGVTITPPPPPDVQVVIHPAPGSTAPPVVSVHKLPPEQK